MTSSAPTAAGDTEPGAIRTELVVADPRGCPVADASAETGGRACRVSRSKDGGVDGSTVGEFELQDARSEDAPAVDCRRLFETDTGDVYRFDADRETPCVCQVVESHGIPVVDAHADDGQLHVTFHATDVDAVRDVVEALRDRHGGVTVRRLWQSGRANADDLAFVDRSRLTDRQTEVLETAYHLGYFDRPRGASGGDVADALDISPSTFAEHLAAAQRKVLGDLLDD
ncbi:helix-turn-helix domain-containing protein [Halorubellus litoreus]|uniref:Helix-turn-helix domain-containing protein n=1 Tax=Halorubellus litoreus TaxID=755308 RepID=A0ABD5VKD3_9EURY